MPPVGSRSAPARAIMASLPSAASIAITRPFWTITDCPTSCVPNAARTVAPSAIVSIDRASGSPPATRPNGILRSGRKASTAMVSIPFSAKNAATWRSALSSPLVIILPSSFTPSKSGLNAAIDGQDTLPTMTSFSILC